MSSIGPQLPPHLTKRKRTTENDPDSPPPKQHKSNEEIDLDDDDDDDSVDSYGPSAPSASSKPSIGPSMPPTLNADEISIGASDSEDDPAPVRPAQAPSSQAQPQKPPSSKAEPAEEPPSSDSDSDSDYGPSLPAPSAQPARVIGPSMPPAAATAEVAAPQRDDWMLAPPSSTSYTERDPTKLRARQFASSKGAPSGGKGDGTVSSIWTETPEQKLERLQNAVLGRSDAATAAPSVAAADRGKKEEEDRRRKIAERVESTRGKSLYDEHQGKRKAMGDEAEEEDDPSKRGFDREKDMAIGGKIGTKERREMMGRAKGFGDRFQSGSFL